MASSERRTYCISSVFIVLASLSMPCEVRAQFTMLFPRYPTDAVLDIAFVDSANGVFCNGAGSIFRTSDGGMTWFCQVHYQGDPISRIKFVDSSLGIAASPYVGMWLDKVNCLVTSNGGKSWSSVDVNLADAEDFLPVSQSVVLKGNDWGINRLDNVFGQWSITYHMPWYFAGDVFIPYGSLSQISVRPGGDLVALFAFWRARDAGVINDSISLLLRSRDGGSTWDTLWEGSNLAFRSTGFATGQIGWLGGEHETLLKTNDGGATWIRQHFDSLAQSSIQKIIPFDTLSVVAVTSSGDFFRTSDGGTTWSSLTIGASDGTHAALAFPTRQRGYYAGRELYRTTDGGATWDRVNNSEQGTASHIQFISRTRGWVLTDHGLYASTDGGNSWTKRNDFSANPVLAHFDFLDSLNGWAVGLHERMKTTDGGSTWSSTALDPSIEWVRGVHFYNKDLGIIYEVWEYPSHYTSNLITSDGGNTWEKRVITNREFPSSWLKVEFTDPQHLWFANQQGLWLSRDTARTWQVFDSVSAFDSGFDMFDSTRGFCDQGFSSFGYTSDGGASWSHLAKPYPNQTFDLAIIDPKAGADSYVVLAGYEGALVEARNGYTAGALNSYTLDLLRRISVVRTGAIADVWVLGSSFQVLHATYYITNAPEENNAVPTSFSLSQNFPNPFNPSTVVEYTVPRAAHVSIRICNILGQVVDELVNEIQGAGRHRLEWKASHLSSGMYFITMESGSFRATRKALLLR